MCLEESLLSSVYVQPAGKTSLSEDSSAPLGSIAAGDLAFLVSVMATQMSMCVQMSVMATQMNMCTETSVVARHMCAQKCGNLNGWLVERLYTSLYVKGGNEARQLLVSVQVAREQTECDMEGVCCGDRVTWQQSVVAWQASAGRTASFGTHGPAPRLCFSQLPPFCCLLQISQILFDEDFEGKVLSAVTE